MSLLVSEFSWTLDRVVILAPRETHLAEAYERVGFHLTTVLQPGRSVRLAQASLAEGRVRGWMSFTLGRRAGCEARWVLWGTPVVEEKPSSALLEQCEGIAWIVDADDEASDSLLRVPLSVEARRKPQFVIGLPTEARPENLRAQAFRRWGRERFEHCLFLESPEGLLTDGLDWLLSF